MDHWLTVKMDAVIMTAAAGSPGFRPWDGTLGFLLWDTFTLAVCRRPKEILTRVRGCLLSEKWLILHVSRVFGSLKVCAGGVMFGGDLQVQHRLLWGSCLILRDLSSLCAWGDNEAIEFCFPSPASVIFHHIWHTVTHSRSKLPPKHTQTGNTYSGHKSRIFKREKQFLDDVAGLRSKGWRQ